MASTTSTSFSSSSIDVGQQGGCIQVDFGNKSQGKMGEAPEWNTIGRGLNCSVKCVNPKCKIKGQYFDTRLGHGRWDLNIMWKCVRCPSCGGAASSTDKICWILYQCEWRDSPQAKWQSQEDPNGYLQYSSQIITGENGKDDRVVAVTIETRALPSITTKQQPTSKPPGGASLPTAASASSTGLTAPLQNMKI
jgi:hypothetical protein